MKRQIALLFALAFLVSGMATIAEENSAATENTEIVAVVEDGDFERRVPFEDGEWMSVPEWNAEVYLPLGWQLLEVTETGFIAADANAESLITVNMEDFAAETEVAEEVEIADAETEETAETENAETEATVVSELESYMTALGQEYEIYFGEEHEMAVSELEESVVVRFLMQGKLVSMEFAPVTEGSIGDSAVTIAETFYMYEVEETAEAEMVIEADGE